MSNGINKVILIGNLGADPEVRFTPGGQAVANFRLATTATWLDKDENKQEATEWHRIVVWGKQAELCGQYPAKGGQAYLEGRLQTRKWTDKQKLDHYTAEIIADQVTFLGSRPTRTSPTPPTNGDNAEDLLIGPHEPRSHITMTIHATRPS